MPYVDTKYIGQCETCQHHSNSGCNTYCDHGEEYSPNLSKIPTADVVEVKRGEWIEGKTLEKCSVCGKKGFPDWHYCPNCGARMDGTPKERGVEK